MGELVMITAFISFYLGGALHAGFVAACDTEFGFDLQHVILSAVFWPYLLCLVITGQD